MKLSRGNKIHFNLLLFFLFSLSAFSQTGEIKGVVKDENAEPVFGAFITLLQNGMVIQAAYSEDEGKYEFVGLNPGKYSVKVSNMGYKDQIIAEINLATNQKLEVNFDLKPSAQELEVVEIITYKKPLVDKDKQATVITAEEIQDLAVRSVKDVAAISGDVISKDDGSGDLNIRGQRSGGTVVYVDGIRINGDINIPQSAIEQVEVITGGVPAMYGDVSGGLILVTTKGAGSKYFGGAEVVTSQFIDGYGYNLVNAVVGGPIIPARKDSNGFIVKKSPLGFILSVEGSYVDDPRPSAIGSYKINDDVYNDLVSNPLRANESGSGTLLNAEFVTKKDIESIKARQNVESKYLNLSGKVDYLINDKMSLTAGTHINFNDNRGAVYSYSLFNSQNNPRTISNKYSGFLRFKHRFGNDTTRKNAFITNGHYQVQFSYNKSSSSITHPLYNDDVFSYGYLGKFKTSRNPVYKYEKDGPNGDAYYYKGEESVLFEIIELNKANDLSNYARQYYEIYDNQPKGNYESYQQAQAGGALLNGDSPPLIYSLWNSPGANYSYGNYESSMYELNGAMAFTVKKKHNINVGVEYRKQVSRNYALAANSLWTLMRQHANSKNTQLDLNNPQLVYANNVFLDTVNYNYAYQPTVQDGDTIKGFFEKVRDKLGVAYNQFFDSDQYGPEVYDLALFNADEIYGNNSNTLSNYGYDYKGNKLTSSSLQDFFSKKDENGAFTREIAPFEPIYIAGYIQDKFEFEDIVFNLGLRVDRYDANQMVLKDKYSLYQIKKVSELGSGYIVPSGVGQDFAVYVDDNNASSPQIVGYRNGNDWYNSKGEKISDASEIAKSTSSGAITPFLTNPKDDIKSSSYDVSKTFEDYQAQFNFMPRINFTFNMSEKSSFFAHYDILFQRPQEAISYLDPTDYLFLDQNIGGILNNPNLKPVKTVDYELGFQQAINEKSAITISAYYRDMDDLVNVNQVQYAYPRSYITYENIDFGTVKGFSIHYDLRPIQSNLRFSAFYNLQFADGTGSGSASNATLLQNGFSAVRTVNPLSFDQRHNFRFIIDYHYKDGIKYNGPSWGGWGSKILSNAGVNFVLKAYSGNPYTRQANFTQDVAIGIAQKPVTDGSVNGSRMPWSYAMDMRINKRIFKYGKGGDKATPVIYEVYLAVLNLLDTKNIVNVYRATGNPDDDGFLTAATSQSTIEAQTNVQAFQDLYALKVNSPYNYTLPRRIRLGFTIGF